VNHESSLDDETYLKEFCAYQVDAGEFHHREHLRVAYALLVNNSPERAFSELRTHILGLLNYLGVGTSKYNETMTYAWLLVVHHFMCMTARCKCFDEFIQRNPILLDQRIIYTHYSEALIKSDKAKAQCLEADLEKIPRHPGIA